MYAYHSLSLTHIHTHDDDDVFSDRSLVCSGRSSSGSRRAVVFDRSSRLRSDNLYTLLLEQNSPSYRFHVSRSSSFVLCGVNLWTKRILRTRTLYVSERYRSAAGRHSRRVFGKHERKKPHRSWGRGTVGSTGTQRKVVHAPRQKYVYRRGETVARKTLSSNFRLQNIFYDFFALRFRRIVRQFYFLRNFRLSIFIVVFFQNRRWLHTEDTGSRPRMATGAGMWWADVRSPIFCCPACSVRSRRTCWKISRKFESSGTTTATTIGWHAVGYRPRSTWPSP